MKKLFICIAFNMLVFSAMAQKSIKAIHIGDDMPNYSFPILINSQTQSTNLRDYRGKWVLLDFWSSWCSTCIEAFPHMQELQNKFMGKLQIFLVNEYERDDQIYVKNVVARIKRNTGTLITLPISLHDKVLNSYFPNKSIPHEIIIDPKGKIYAITHMANITEENISSLVKGKMVSFPLKDDFWDNNLPLISKKNYKDNDDLLVYSSLTATNVNKFSSMMKEGLKQNAYGKDIGYFSNDVRLIDLYRKAYVDLFKEAPEVLFETQDSVFNEQLSKTFCYDLIVPPSMYSWGFVTECLKQDLNRGYNFSFKKEKRIFRCLIGKANNNLSRYRTKFTDHYGNLEELEKSKNNNLVIYSHNTSISGIISSTYFQKLFQTVKSIDDSNNDILFDIEFPVDFDFTNKQKLIAYLHERGIDITIENRELDCVIVSDKKPGDPTILN